MSDDDEMVAASFDDDGVQVSSSIGPDGKEYPDPVPMAPPVGYTAPQSLGEMIRQMVQHEAWRKEMNAQGADTFEDADDFDVEDDPVDPLTPYEQHFEGKLLTDDEEVDLIASARKLSEKEQEDGKSGTDEGRVVDSSGRDGQPDKVKSGKSKSQQKSAAGGSVHEADRGAARSEE